MSISFSCSFIIIIVFPRRERLTEGGINHYTAGQTTAFNFADWDNFAKVSSFNKNAKVYLGVPASPTAAGTGYVDITTLGSAAQYLQKTYSSFGGIMMWYVLIKRVLTAGIVPKHGPIWS